MEVVNVTEHEADEYFILPEDINEFMEEIFGETSSHEDNHNTDETSSQDEDSHNTDEEIIMEEWTISNNHYQSCILYMHHLHMLSTDSFEKVIAAIPSSMA